MVSDQMQREIPKKKDGEIISLIVPTRNRPENLRRFSQYLRANTADHSRVELVLIIDDDDRSYDNMSFEGLWVTKVTTPRGSTMGELNRAGYRACSGEYVMLMNDDVVIETPGWDRAVLEVFHAHPDDVVLVHVNDGIFHDTLCTFPFLTRRYCELADGICPADYRRYRIDDHIYNVFNLISVLGHNRIIYLPDVSFRHLNFETDDHGRIEYQPDPAIHAADTVIFDAALPERKALALKLVEVIDRYRAQQIQLTRSLVLDPISDSVSLRRPEFVRTFKSSSQLTSEQVRVTVGVVSADIQSEHAQACLRALKAYTHNFDLVVLDNNRGPNFNHPREMNRIIGACRNNYLVLMDDDVIVEAGWLNGLLSGIGPQVGVVTPLHKSADGKFSYAGVVMRPDYSGRHTHGFVLYPRAFPIQTLCSAILLIDMNKCGQIRFDESYSKYFLDLDYGLRVWESGFHVVCSPEVSVTHLGGATLDWDTDKSRTMVEEQRQHFVRSWIDTGRYRAIESSPLWQSAPEIASILNIPQKLSSFLEERPEPDPNRALSNAHDFFDQLDRLPTIKQWVCERLWAELRDREPDFADLNGRNFAALVGHLEYPILLDDDGNDFATVLWSGAYYAFEKPSLPFEAGKASAGFYRSAARRNLLMSAVDGGVSVQPPHGNDRVQPVLVEEDYKGFNLVQYVRVHAIAQCEGEFDPARAIGGGYRLSGETASSVKAQIDALNPILLEQNYKGFNIVAFDRIYGLAQRQGAFDPLFAARVGYPLRGLTTASVKAQIDRMNVVSLLYRKYGPRLSWRRLPSGISERWKKWQQAPGTRSADVR